MKSIICSLFAVIFFSAGFVSVCPAGEAPAEIRKAAGEGINVFFKDPRMTGLQNLGFNNQADLDNASAGEGFRVFTIPPDRLLNKDFPQDLSALVVPTNQWQFIVKSTNGAKALLTVDIMKNRWTPVSLGAAGLARQLSDVIEAWPPSSGYSYRLIRVYQAKTEFIELSQGSRVLGIVPLGSLSAVLGAQKKVFDPADIRDTNDILPGLRPAVQLNLQGVE